MSPLIHDEFDVHWSKYEFYFFSKNSIQFFMVFFLGYFEQFTKGRGGGRQTPWNLFPSWFPNAVHVILYIINVLCLEWIESKLFTLFLRKVNMSTKLKKTIKEKIQDIKDQRDVIVAFLDEFVAEVCDWILCMMVVKRNHILEPTGPKGVYWLFTFVSVDL